MSNFGEFESYLTAKRVMNLFSKNDKKKLVQITLINTALALLDLIGVAFIGVLGALTISGVSSKSPSPSILKIIDALGLSNFQFQNIIAILGFIAASSLLLRTGLSYFFTRRMLHFLSRRGAQISSETIVNFFNQSYTKITNKSLQDLTYELTDGVKALVMGIVGSIILIVGDCSLLLVLSASLFVIDPLTAVIIFTSFTLLGILIYKKYQNVAIDLSSENSKLVIRANQMISETLSNYKELYARNQLLYSAKEIGKIRLQSANSFAELAFLPNVSKYVIEAFLVVSALIISGIQFYLTDVGTAISILTVFLAAGSRIAPALLRIQQNAILMRSSLGYASPVLEMIETFIGSNVQEQKHIESSTFRETISFENVSFAYQDNLPNALSNVSFEVKEKMFFGIVGTSGAGKSTLLDLMLGILKPTDGKVEVSGVPPTNAIELYPGSISYVPQDAQLISGSVKQNLHFGVPAETYSERHMISVMQSVGLGEFIENLPNGLESDLGVNGFQLSGGEAQRLALARALLSNPKILILDEALSALDNITEIAISNNLSKLKGKITLIMITHRLTSLLNFDNIIVLDNGEITDEGTFNVLKSNAAFFDENEIEQRRQ
jgi:ABC-type multidrug transport system fused ATPase/permease subunit